MELPKDPMTVSYTHLDVYKRQVEGKLDISTPKQTYAKDELVEVLAVSYTHLVVRKFFLIVSRVELANHS